jgi:hypothetical protein
MEDDFNAINKTIYGVRMLANVRKYKLIPEEVYSERKSLANDGTLSKILFFDIARQLCHSAGLASVDANNCYDRIAHPMASLIFQAIWHPDSSHLIEVVNNPENEVLPFHRLRGLGRLRRGQPGQRGRSN